MGRFDVGMISTWIILSFIFTILILASFFFLLIPSFEFGGCSLDYIDNDQIVFSGFDPLGNVYLVIFTPSSFDEVNSTYPYVTTLPPIPVNANSSIYAVAKFSADMNLLWARIIGAPHEEYIEFMSFAISEDGGLLMYATGTDFLTVQQGNNVGYVLKLNSDGELDFVLTWPHLDENYRMVAFDDTGEFIAVPYFLPETGNGNYLEKSGNENTVAKISQGLEWISYLPNDTVIHDIKANDTAVALIVSRERPSTEGIFVEEWSFVTLDADSGEFTSVLPLNIPETVETSSLKLTTRENRFLIFMPSFNYNTITLLDPVSANSSVHQLFPNPFFSNRVNTFEKNGIFIASTITGSDTQMPFGEEVEEITWNGDRNRLSVMAIDSAGNEVGRLRVQGNFWINSIPIEFKDNEFLIATPLYDVPFELTDGFQTYPLGTSDPFVAVVGEDRQVGTFYGNSGNPVMLCY